ncbi:MAG: diadenylate cyclase [Pirellulales bacterium]
MKPARFDAAYESILQIARQLAEASAADCLLVLVDEPTDWQALRQAVGEMKLLLATDLPEAVEGADKAGIPSVVLDMSEAPVSEQLTQALLLAVAREELSPGAAVVAVYSAFEAGRMDSLSYIHLEEHLGRLTARDLQRLVTSVPLDTLKAVVDLAIEIGREGREGTPVGSLFVVGDTRRVLQHIHPAGFDPVKGYSRKERNLRDARVREAIKEIAPLDGAFIVASDGTVEKACQLIDAAHASLTLSKGLGSRHWAAAAISKITSAVAVAVSQSNGTVRLFQNGEVILRIEPFRRAMKWKATEQEADPATE